MRDDVDFEQLVQQHHAALYRFALSMTGHEADAADHVQETFLRWATHGHQLADPAKVKSWLFTTLHREVLNRRRRVVRFPTATLEDAAPELPAVPPPPPEARDAATVLAALARVDEVFRGAVTLFYLEDWSQAEVAEILGVPLGTVKSRIARGVAQLQTLLARDLAAGRQT